MNASFLLPIHVPGKMTMLRGLRMLLVELPSMRRVFSMVNHHL